MSAINTNSLQAARQAMKNGRKQEAREWLQQAVQENPNEYRAWLWLAGLAASPHASLGYIAQAETIKPHDPTIAKARAWAESRLQATNRPKPVRRKGQHQLMLAFAGGALLIVALLVAGILKIVLENPTQPVVAAGQVALPLSVHQAGVEGADYMVAGATEVTAVTVEPPPAETNQPATPPQVTAMPSPAAIAINPKSIALAGNEEPVAPRATWTATPLPTSTPTATPIPTATPTYAPTIVSASAQVAVPRPAGVGLNERWIDVNLTTQTLTAMEGNQVVRVTRISSGLPRTPTVTGQFRIYLRYPKQDMDGYRLGFNYYLRDVPYVQYFYGNYGLHGTYWHNNFGTPMSHGCVNLPTPEAEWLYHWATIGTLVYVHY